MKDVKIEKIDSKEEAPLFCRYAGQNKPQPAYIEFQLDGTMSADWDGESSGTMPMDVWHQSVLRWNVPAELSAEAANELMESIRPLASKLLDHWWQEWNGSNHVGRFDSEGEHIDEAIRGICLKAEPDLNIWDAGEWLAEAPPSELIKRDESVTDAAERLALDAKSEGAVIEGGVGAIAGYLTEYLIAKEEGRI